MQAADFLVVIPAYNAGPWIHRNIDSLLAQTHARWRAVYVDDASEDDTAEKVRSYLAQRGASSRFEVIRNRTRLRPARSRQLAYSLADDEEVVCMLDGDDWLLHSDALRRVAALYTQRGMECSYGQYQTYDGEELALGPPSPTRDFDPSLLAAVGYRGHPWVSSHLRTMRARHIKSIPLSDLRDHKGEWLVCCTDLAEMYWTLEQCEGRHCNLSEPVYVYNRFNSRLFSTSWYNREANPEMTRYREQVRAMLRRTGPTLSLCLALSPVERRIAKSTIDTLRAAAAPLGQAVELVVLFGLTEAELDAGTAPAALPGLSAATELGFPSVRTFCCKAPKDSVTLLNTALSLGAGPWLLPLDARDQPRTVELRMLVSTTGKPAIIETPFERAPEAISWPAIARTMYHRVGGIDERLPATVASTDLVRRVRGKEPILVRLDDYSESVRGPLGFGVPVMSIPPPVR